MSSLRGVLAVFAALVALGCFDLYLHYGDVQGNDYSECIESWGIQHRVVDYLLGVGLVALLTHWFIDRATKRAKTPPWQTHS